MAEANEWFKGHVLIAGDSRVRRLFNHPDIHLALNVDYEFSSGVQIEDMIALVDARLDETHSTLILIGLVGDAIKKEERSLSPLVTASLLFARGGAVATKVLTALVPAHRRWQAAFPALRILWTMPYHLDIATYNRQVVGAPLSEELLALSYLASQKFVEFCNQIIIRWSYQLPDVKYLHLNELLFFGYHRHLLRSFGGDGQFYKFPKNVMVDGLHPSKNTTDRLWRMLEKNIVTRVQNNTSEPELEVTPNPIQARLSFPCADPVRVIAAIPKGKPSQYKSKVKRLSGGRNLQSLPYCIPVGDSIPSTSTSRNVEVHPTLQVPPRVSNHAVVVEEGVTDSFGNLTWKACPNLPVAPLGTVQRSKPILWSWAYHNATIKKLQEEYLTASMAEEIDALKKIGSIIRERGLDAMQAGLVPEVNAASAMWGRRGMAILTDPAKSIATTDKSLVGLLPPPPPPPV